jgi:hypothetical protein
MRRARISKPMLSSGEPMGKAGACAVQGLAAAYMPAVRRQLLWHHGAPAVSRPRTRCGSLPEPPCSTTF